MKRREEELTTIIPRPNGDRPPHIVPSHLEALVFQGKENIPAPSSQHHSRNTASLPEICGVSDVDGVQQDGGNLQHGRGQVRGRSFYKKGDRGLNTLRARESPATRGLSL